MKVYFDICALKRPWDDQRQPRIAAETSVIVSMMHMIEDGTLTPLRSPAHDEENARNNDPARAAAISAWLAGLPLPRKMPREVATRAKELVDLRFSAFDALHLSWAEALSADLLVTTDDVLIRRASRKVVGSAVHVIGPLLALDEITRRKES
jgi:hypothetical protein